jgi:hypothetical protein
MQPSDDSRAWLEERLFQDDSMDVKAAALGALVYQAHYAGDGDAVLGYLERARKLTDDEGALAMIAEGERMVKDYDPRNLELELAGQAEFLDTVARYTEGPAARSFQRQAKQLQQIVASLRATRDGAPRDVRRSAPRASPGEHALQRMDDARAYALRSRERTHSPVPVSPGTGYAPVDVLRKHSSGRPPCASRTSCEASTKSSSRSSTASRRWPSAPARTGASTSSPPRARLEFPHRLRRPLPPREGKRGPSSRP